MLNITMSEARQRNYSLGFEDKDQDKRAQSALSYVDMLASQVKANVSGWPVSLFKTESGGIEKDRAKINQKFFSYLETVGPSDKPKLTLEQIEQIKSEVKQSLGTELDHYQSQIREAQRAIKNYYRDIESKQGQLVQAQRALDALKNGAGPEIRIIEAINKTSEDGFFTFLGVRNGYVDFLTAPITLRFVDPPAKIDTSCYMGRYYVRIKIRNMRVTVEPAFENSKFGDYIHPHVDSDGTICWGSIDVSKEKVEKNYLGILSAARFVLTNYNDQSAYRIIDNFRKVPVLMNSIRYVSENPGTPFDVQKPRVFDAEGYDQWGYDKDGFNRDGIDRDGYDRDGFNEDGFDREGYDSEGYNYDGEDRDGNYRPSDDDYEGDE